jgi:hypothetical protein
MLIPRFWARAKGDATDPKGKKYALNVWGWSQDGVTDALAVAQRRLREGIQRLARGEPSDEYFYGRQPLREEILRTLGDPGAENEAMVTRNRYGAEVLNTARIPFVDVDAPRSGGSSGFFGLFKKKDKEDPILARLREACGRSGRSTFRIYKTSAGYRVLAPDLSLDPKSQDTQDFLGAFGSDPAFMKLCRIQGSFRARLTPKPWRIDVPPPPNQFPREDPSTRAAFSDWLKTYESAAQSFATCRFLESVGSMLPTSRSRALIEEHDRATQAESGRPLA